MTLEMSPGHPTGPPATIHPPTGLLGRLRATMRSARDNSRSARVRRLSEAWAVLADARTVVEHGWLQNAWYAPRPAAAAPVADPAAAILHPDDTPAACLVGAVVHAARRHYPGAHQIDAAPALDALWDAWQDSRGLAGTDCFGRAAAPEVRAARVRDLTRWNDQPHRTRAEVLDLLDVAVSRAMTHAAHLERPTPAPVR